MKYPVKIFHILLAAIFCTCLNGCVFLVVGGVAAVGGYAVSPDTFEGVSSKGQEELLASAHKVISIMGTITDERPKDGEIVGKINGVHVTVEVIQLNLTTSKLRVKAREAIFPRVAVAQQVYTKIMNQLEQ
ncbi:MAG: hypothetical protein HQL12_01750 [Candidatus Omnitrophica bacterium]|nr:hypothetical protein [Candidatus Omnitrophota bacterium]